MQSDGVEFNPGMNREDADYTPPVAGDNSGETAPGFREGAEGTRTEVRLRSTSELPAELKNNPGRTVEGEVIKNTGENEYLVEINGRQITVETDFPLREGDVLELTMAEDSPGELLLVGLNPGEAGEIMSADEARDLLVQMDFSPASEAVDLIQLLAREGGLPARDELADMLDYPGLLKDSDGGFSSRRLRAFLFLKQNDLPVSKKLLDLLEAEASEQVLERLEGEDFLPRLNFDEGRLADQLQEVINRLGLDLERQLTHSPGRAGETVRARLAGVVLELFASEEFESSTQRGEENYGSLLKHSLASTVEGDTVFFLIPFQTEEGTDFFQVRFRDERSQQEGEDQEKWSVRLKIELSRLGEIVVDTRRRQEKLKVELAAAEAETLSLLRKNSELLREMLVDLGYKPAVNCRSLAAEEKEDLVEERLLQLSQETLHRLDLEA